MSSDTLNKQTVKANLKSLPKDAYQLLPVDAAEPIREWVKSQGIPYLIGHAYYQLTKTETIQPQKNIAVLELKTSKVYTGRQARDVLGLPRRQARV